MLVFLVPGLQPVEPPLARLQPVAVQTLVYRTHLILGWQAWPMLVEIPASSLVWQNQALILLWILEHITLILLQKYKKNKKLSFIFNSKTYLF